MCCMCFEEATCLKKTVQISQWVMGIIAALSLVAGLTLCILVPFQDQDSNVNVWYDGKMYIGSALISNSVHFGLIAVLAYLGLKKFASIWTHRTFLSAYVCCGALSAVSFMALAFFSSSILVMQKDFKKDGDPCEKIQLFKHFEKFYSKSGKALCSEGCPCNIKDEDIFQKDVLADLTYSKDKGAINVMGCKEFDDISKKLKFSKKNNATDIFTSLEITFECAGICKQHPHYVFSDVNRGAPVYNGTCYQALDTNLNRYGQPFYIFAWTLFVGLTFAVICGMLLCLCTNESQFKELEVQEVQYQEVSQENEAVQQDPQQQQEDTNQDDQQQKEEQ